MPAEPQATQGADVERGGRGPLVGRWLSLLWQTTQAIRLYDLDHPVVWDKAGEALDAWRNCVGGDGAFMVALSPEGFTFEGHGLEPDATLDELAQQLNGHNVAAVEFRGQITPEQVVALAQCLGLAATHAVDQQPLEQRVESASDGRVRVISLDCDRLGRRDGVRHGATDAGPNWESLVYTAIGSPDQAASPGVLAEQINASMRAAEPAQLDELRQALERSAVTGQAGDADRVRQFVGGLNPEMRDKLFSADAGHSAAALSLVGEVADVLETDEIVAAMNSVQLKGLQVSPETLRMCRKLALCLGQTDRPEEDRAALRDELAQLEAQVNLVGGVTLDDLTEVFERRSTDQYTPDDYKDHLNTLTGGSEDEAASRAVDETQYIEEADTHAAEVAVMTLETTDTADRGECNGALDYLSARLEKLIGQGRLLTVQEAADQAERWAKGCDCQATRDAAGALLKRLEDERIVEALLDRAVESQAMVEQATRLLRCATASTARAVFEKLSAVTDPKAYGRLHGVLDAAEPAVLQSAVGELVGAGRDTELNAVLRYARLADQGRGAPLMQMLLNHPRADVSLGAASVLFERHWVQASTVGRWLTDPREPLRRYAIDCLIARDDDASVEQLGEWLEGVKGGDAPSPAMVCYAIESAAQRSPRVLSRACRVLLRLTESMKPSNARLAKRIAVALAAHGKTEEVRQSIAGWRFSGTRLVGLLYEGGAWCIRAVKR